MSKVKSKSMSDLAAMKDTVILHSIERGKTVPNISPFVMKLETFLRMMEIPYQYDTKKPFGPSGKTPWITLNGVDMTDSQLIIEFLIKKYNKDPWNGAKEEEKAVARSLRVMMEEHFFWGMARWRFNEGISVVPNLINISSFKFRAMKWVVPGKVNKMLHAQGMGRHTYENICKLTTEDMRNVSTILGDKPFILGNEPCEVDCALFGFLAQALWAAPGSPFHNLIENELGNLKEYCNRMKNKFWPDWDDCLFKKA